MFFYTWPLKYIGLGEIAVVLIWGPLMVGGGYFVITGQWDWNVVIASLPYALGATSVIFGKHIDKLPQERPRKKIRTMPVLLGEKLARYAVMGMLALMYLLVIALVITRYFSPVMLVVLLALPTLKVVWRAYRAPKPAEQPAGTEGVWPLWFSAASFYHNRAYGLYFLLGLLVNFFIK